MGEEVVRLPTSLSAKALQLCHTRCNVMRRLALHGARSKPSRCTRITRESGSASATCARFHLERFCRRLSGSCVPTVLTRFPLTASIISLPSPPLSHAPPSIPPPGNRKKGTHALPRHPLPLPLPFPLRAASDTRSFAGFVCVVLRPPLSLRFSSVRFVCGTPAHTLNTCHGEGVTEIARAHTRLNTHAHPHGGP